VNGYRFIKGTPADKYRGLGQLVVDPARTDPRTALMEFAGLPDTMLTRMTVNSYLERASRDGEARISLDRFRVTITPCSRGPV
jgi:hypothetical protein